MAAAKDRVEPPPLPRRAQNAAPTPSTIRMVCIEGRDIGKSVRFDRERVCFGRSVVCDFASDDPEVAQEHVTLILQGAQVNFAVIGESHVTHNGQSSTSGTLRPGERMQIGGSVWGLRRIAGHNNAHIVRWINTRVASFIGVDDVRNFNLPHILSNVVQPRTDAELEAQFRSGSGSSGIPLEEIDTNWPTPWAFAWVLALLIAACICFLLMWTTTGNVIVEPGLYVLGAFATPWALVVLFYEFNTPRNVSFFQLIKLFIIGAMMSFVFTLILRAVTQLDMVLGMMAFGPIEEISKAAVLMLLIHKQQYRWTLNGLLFGATVGAGFSAFETLGYAFQSGLGTLFMRGVLEIFASHILWTGIVGAALWNVRGDRPFEPRMLLQLKFLRAMALAIALHMIWNGLPLLAWLPVALISWTAVLAYVQAGLKEIRNAQLQANSLAGA